MKCCRDKCGLPGAFVPRLNLPAAGVPLDLQRPMGLILNFPLCPTHVAEFNAERKNIDGNRAHLEPILEQHRAELGRAPVDWARAWFTAVPMASDEYKKLLALGAVDPEKKAR